MNRLSDKIGNERSMVVAGRKSQDSVLKHLGKWAISILFIYYFICIIIGV